MEPLSPLQQFCQQLETARPAARGINVGGKTRSFASIINEFQTLAQTSTDLKTVVNIVKQIHRLDEAASRVFFKIHPAGLEKIALPLFEQKYQKLIIAWDSELNPQEDEIVSLINDATYLIDHAEDKSKLLEIRSALQLMQQKIEKQERVEISGGEGEMLHLTQLLEGVPEDQAEGVQRLLEKHFCINDQSHYYTVQDYKLLTELGEKINPKLDPILNAILEEMGASFDKQKAILEKYSTMSGQPFLLHDLFWELYDPINPGLDPGQIEKFAAEFETEWPEKFTELRKNAEDFIDHTPPSEALLKHKIEWLKGKKLQRREELKEIPSALIIGGGPGGLASALVADTLGCNWEVVEKRPQYTRWNEVVLGGREVNYLLRYFGIYDRLVLDKKVEPHVFLEVKLMDLEYAMRNILTELHVEEQGKVTEGRFLGLQQGEEGVQIVLEDGIRRNPDFLLGLDGAKSTTAEVLGISREAYSQDSWNLAVSLKNPGGTRYALSRMKEEERKEYNRLESEIAACKNPEELKRLQGEKERMIKAMVPGGEQWEIVSAQPFRITVTKADRSTALMHNTLGMVRGDAYATPDPSTGLGCSNAISGAAILGRCIGEKIAGKPLADIRTETELSVDLFYRGMVQQSLANRKNILKIGRADYTPLCGVNYLLMKGALKGEQAKQFKLVIEKLEKALPLTEQERALVVELKPMVQEESKRNRLYEPLANLLV